MSIEEKAKAYDEALEKAKECHEKYWQVDAKFITETLFPELRESEDERIRKEIIDFLETIPASELKRIPRPVSEWFSWLEKQNEYHIPWYDYQKSKEAGYTIVPNEEYEQLIKQKEQKPAAKQDYSGLTDLERAIHRGFLAAGVENVPVGIIKETTKDCIAHFPWPTEWSKEDSIMLDSILSVIEEWERNQSEKEKEYYGATPKADWLKSLRPSWKPSEELLNSLRDTIIQTKGHSYSMYLPELYEQLKKL